MSDTSNALYVTPPPQWMSDLIGAGDLSEGHRFQVMGEEFVVSDNIPRNAKLHTQSQQQTSDTFGFKWQKRETFEGEVATALSAWLREKYGEITKAKWFNDYGKNPVVLDAGCGAAVSGIALFEPALDRIRYIGADVSRAVDVARTRFFERGYKAGFIQADLQNLPLPEESVDLIFSEGVLHHTDDTRQALVRVSRHLKKNGRILFYVYRLKGPIREFTDDYIRDKMQVMSPEQGWAALKPLTLLGKQLGELDIDIDIEEPIDLLNIPAGRINIQRLFYWHIFKAYYRPDMNIDEMNHLNFDWYAPANAHRHTPEEVRSWCAEIGLEVEHERIENAGITIIARKK